jgi:hypothetical protein
MRAFGKSSDGDVITAREDGGICIVWRVMYEMMARKHKVLIALWAPDPPG